VHGMVTIGPVKPVVLGRYELEQVLGLSRTRVVQLMATDPLFPKPIAELSMGKVWDFADIEQYAADTGRTLHPLAAKD
jgi:predicted DNA-binding transcriptional regulator AlpA